jgi:hypothetical protein|tara:strand:+ start:36 stop:1541 length:1506 start_codon:yes stop_codon:yes gene_type:complete
MTTLDQITPEQVREITGLVAGEGGYLTFVDFLDLVVIQVPPQPLEGIIGGRIPFEKWDYLMEIAAAFDTHQRIVVLKARQLGFSWICAAFAVYLMRFKPGARVGMFSKDEREAWRLLEKAETIYRNLPPSWQLPLAINSRSELRIRFEDGIESSIEAFASTLHAGRGENFTAVFQDEGDFHQYLAENFMAVLPTTDDGGWHVIGSTVNKRLATSVFQETFREADKKGWTRLFFPWNSRPGRDAAWYKRTKANIPETIDITPELYMEQEFPESVEQALAPARASSFFDQDVLRTMQNETKKPMEVLHDVINIYQNRRPNRRYAMGSDVSHGVGLDYHASVVVDIDNGVIVADILHNNISMERFAFESVHMSEMYGAPRWAIEDNDMGQAMIDLVKSTYRYRRLYKRTTGRGAQKEGWHTDRITRPKMFATLRDAIDNGHLTVFNKEGLQHFFDVMVSGKDLKPEARGGAHDDYVIAVAVALQARGKVFSNRGQELLVLPMTS